jgi:cytochrome c55X
MKRMPVVASILLVSASHLAIADISTQRQTELMYLLKQDCGSCHGMTLKGGLGPALLPETLNGKPRELLVTTILEGRTGTAMPPWKAMLTQDEAEWITVQLQQGVK